MRVLIEIRHSDPLFAAAATSAALVGELGEALSSDLAQGFQLDAEYGVVQVPAVRPDETGRVRPDLAQPLTFSLEPEETTYLVRGAIPDAPPDQAAVLASARRNPIIVGIFADPTIENTLVCPGSPAVGNSGNVAANLCVQCLTGHGLDGSGVHLAVVDTGINEQYLQGHGRTSSVDIAQSWTPSNVPTTPGMHPVNHGTMCAWDCGIAAPKSTLLDHAVLLSRTPGGTVMAGLLSDAVKSYSKLLSFINQMAADTRAMVVSNSWGMFDPKWDFPVGDPGNYSDNPSHPFNIIVAALESAGADILFAAGNCGRNCPDGRCAFGNSRPICGANSHPKVMSIAGIDVNKNRVGYSSQGPGRLAAQKPDLATYTHFVGSGVYPADGGTSAACPVAAGVVTAIRTKWKASSLSPGSLRSLLFQTAEDLGPVGYDYDFGWGGIDVQALLSRLP